MVTVCGLSIVALWVVAVCYLLFAVYHQDMLIQVTRYTCRGTWLYDLFPYFHTLSLRTLSSFWHLTILLMHQPIHLLMLYPAISNPLANLTLRRLFMLTAKRTTIKVSVVRRYTVLTRVIYSGFPGSALTFASSTCSPYENLDIWVASTI